MAAGREREQAHRGLLDAGTLILLPRTDDPAGLPDEPLISTITLAEADFDPLPFDARSARAFGGVAVSLRRSGRKRRSRAFDALIAAVALASDLPIYTANRDDFTGIDGLEVVAVDVPPR